MRHKGDGGAFPPCAYRDDVCHARGEAQVRPACISLLHPNFESIQPQLIDDVLAGARVLGAAYGTAANRARKHLDVRAGFFGGDPWRGPAAGDRARGNDGEKESAGDPPANHAGRVAQTLLDAHVAAEGLEVKRIRAPGRSDVAGDVALVPGAIRHRHGRVQRSAEAVEIDAAACRRREADLDIAAESFYVHRPPR